MSKESKDSLLDLYKKLRLDMIAEWGRNMFSCFINHTVKNLSKYNRIHSYLKEQNYYDLNSIIDSLFHVWLYLS